MRREPGPWPIPAAALGEIGHLVASRGVPSSLDLLRDDIERGVSTLDCGEPDISRVRPPIERDADVPLGLLDATVIACTGRNGGGVATLDLPTSAPSPAREPRRLFPADESPLRG